MSIAMRWNSPVLLVSAAVTATACGGGKDSTSPVASPYVGAYSGVIRAGSAMMTAAPAAFRLHIDTRGNALITVYDVNAKATFQLHGGVDAGGWLEVPGAGGAPTMAGNFVEGGLGGGAWENGTAATHAAGSWYAERDGTQGSLFTTARYPVYRIITPEGAGLLNVGISLAASAPVYQEFVVPEAALGPVLKQETRGRFQAATTPGNIFILYGNSEVIPDRILWVTNNGQPGVVTAVVVTAALSKYFVPPEAGGLGINASELFPQSGSAINCKFAGAALPGTGPCS